MGDSHSILSDEQISFHVNRKASFVVALIKWEYSKSYRSTLVWITTKSAELLSK